MSEDNKKRKHERVNDILLGPIERPALAWLCVRLPGWVTPDQLTAFGFVAGLLIALSYYLSNYHKGFLWLASLGFVLNWFGDSLDGNLARHRKIERPKYGFYIDHTVDTLTQVIIFVGLGLSPFVDFRIACLTLIGYLMMSILVYVTTFITGVFQISYSKLGPTEIRVIAIIINTIVFFATDLKVNFSFGSLTFFDIALSIIALLLLFFYISTMLKQLSELSDIDRKQPKSVD
ncbi:MAG: CDP-alcohol phosphatidyltransferase family protein [Anaerolineaceae bacterium]|nr:CDP-alcohol phosphatidyltransferase family protein [Anaerolineaceae bacterium]